MRRRFERAMWLMRRRDPQLREDGFHLLLPHAAEHVDELIAEFTAETEDHGLKYWLLELIGESRSPAALPTLIAQLHTEDESLRHWAARGLELLATPESRHELWKARTNALIE
ncbi:HEAT repeat domain-containing protein [Bailinhaonella thermotolerans]|uniref:HEAT repeat domain-containing protein n=1 Tax=Bailinhaonella thermotolerans TaxID=1070861 RepID=A0A3A4AX50_9ACTN|nr:HEAT repeat domain-containing protein [Bailinhaonella thermotolerans]RJL31964.1 HEAT repeat domain-containing protein [Bailinhaonella thermotolerans]